MRKIILALSLLLMICTAAFANTNSLNMQTASEIQEKIKTGDWIELSKIYGFNNGNNKVTSELLASWWDVFHDPTMTKLIAAALENNKDMAAARANVAESRYQLGISQADLLPWLDANGSWTNSRTPSDTGGTGSASQFWGLGIDASWEIDIFGGKRASVKAQRANFEAQYAALYSTWTTVAAEVALDYISLRTLQGQLNIATQNVKLQQETVDIQQSRVDAGLTDSLALKQAQYTLEQTRSEIPTIVASIERTKNALAVLVGEVPGSLHKELLAYRPIPKIESVSLVGIPANTIRQRSDIREAERNFMAQMARKKAAKADLWPKFYLTGAIGTQAHEGSLFSGAGKTYSFLPQISWPIFHAGAITRNIKAQGAKAEHLLAVYEQTVLNAVAEVRDALSDSVQEYIRNMTLKNGLEAAQNALELAQEKYTKGLVDFTNVIDAQVALASLSNDYVISCGQISSNAVKLFKALGGGWKPLEEAERALAEVEAK